MNVILKSKSIMSFFSLCVLSMQSVAYAAGGEEAKIRQIVQGILKEKDDKIGLLEQRIEQLEKEKATQEKLALPVVNPVSKVESVADSTAAITKPKKDVEKSSESNKSLDIVGKIDEFKEAAAEKGLEISAFMDVNAKTGNSTDQTFSVGSVEVDMDYSFNDHFGASAALVLCGNSMNTDTSAPAAIYCGNSGAGGLSGGSTMAGFAAAFLDYHMLGDDKEPPRGRLFDHRSVHIQAGRFDLPFGLDYQNFANKDRVTITMPLTTSRMQMAGYNSDGVRSYGAWGLFNYSVYWTDALYANDGNVVGGRLGMYLDGSHHDVQREDLTEQGVELGISHLSELDGQNNIRNSVYGADLTVNEGIFRWTNEVMYLNGHQDSFLETNADGITSIMPMMSDISSPFGKNNQLGYHSTLVTDLESFVNYPVLAFARFSRWQPSQDLGLDYDGTTVAVGDISMLTFGLNYKVNNHLSLKVEYNDSLGTKTQEKYFDEKLGIGQMIVAF